LANLQAASFSAAATFGNGYIYIDQYQDQILDTVKRGGVLGKRIKNVPATGPMSRFFEQTAIGTAQFDSRAALAPVATAPTRGEKSLLIKSIDARVAFTLFDMQASQLMPANLQLKAKDLMDMLTSIQLLHDQALWTGTDTVAGAQVGSGGTLQYVGLPAQITTTQSVVVAGASIVDEIRLQVAKMVGSATDNLIPTEIYMNPLAKYALEQEVAQAKNNVVAQVEIVPGVFVDSIMTAAGRLPIVVDPLLTSNPSWATAAPSTQTNYPFVVVTRDLLEYHYIGSENPQLFQVGLVSNLNEDYIGVKFGAPLCKAANRAHVKGVIQRVTY
jgi:hypothetical protein